MIRKISILTISVFILISCSSSSSYLKKGDYHMAVVKAVKKIRRNPKDKDIEVLKKAYPIANKQNLDRIKYLKMEGRPDVWEEILNNYEVLKQRQDLVQTILPLKYSGGTLNFSYVDYNKEIIEAKKKASEYYYVHAQRLMKSGNRFDARDAYYELMKISKYYPMYKETDRLIEKAQILGTTNVLLVPENRTHFRLRKDFLYSLFPKDLTPLNSKWVRYTLNKPENNVHYDIILKLKRIMLSPELLKEKVYTESKRIRDGWEYVLDNNGNVMKDSLGNDIKKEKYKIIKCTVTETLQRREVVITSELNYFDKINNEFVRNIPLTATYFIENTFSVANGDYRALTEETKKKLENKPILMPKDLEMIYQAGNVIRDVVKNELLKNKNVIR